VRVWSEAEKYLANGEKQFGQSQQNAWACPQLIQRFFIRPLTVDP